MHRLEFAAVTQRKTGGLSGYGFALLEAGNGALVATGCGPVQPSVTHNQAAVIGLLQGLRVARQHGLQRLQLQTDSSNVHKQLLRSAPAAEPGCTLSAQLHAAAASGLSELQQVQLHEVQRWENGLAIIQAEFATQLLLQLRKAAAASPSKYSHVAGQLGLLLQLPVHLRRVIETADDFVQTAAEVTAARCGSNSADILAAMRPAADTAEPAASANCSRCSSSANSELLLVPRLAPFTMDRMFTPHEGAAYAAAAAAQASGDSSAVDEHAEATAGFAIEAGYEVLGEAGVASCRLVGGRVVGRHRLNQRLLVVGFHSLPPGWEPGQPLQQDSAAEASSNDMPVQHSAGAAADQQQQPLQQQIAGAEVTKTPASQMTNSSSGSSIITGGDDMRLPSWAVQSSAAGTSEGGGLGISRYQLPPVTSDTATHLLQFDGASRGNPGRAGYGWVLFDLTSGRLAGRGCMSLRYRQSAGQAEFEGLLAGLRAALDAGVTSLAVQGDSALVLDALMYRRGISSKEITVSYHKASQLLSAFQHVDFQFIPREQNSLADRLAKMSMDIDTALHALLRKGDSGVAGLQLITKAARLAKKQHVLEVLLSQYSFPLLLVVTLHRVMSISPQQLLARLQAKAESLGDPNPWLVQEVRKVVEAGVPEVLANQLGSIILDSRYSTASTRARLRSVLATAAAAHQRQQPQEQQQPVLEPLKHQQQEQQQVKLQPVPELQPQNQQQQQQLSPAQDTAAGPQIRGFSTWPAAATLAKAQHCSMYALLHQQHQSVQWLSKWREQALPRVCSSSGRIYVNHGISSSTSSSVVASHSGHSSSSLPAGWLKRACCSSCAPARSASCIRHVPVDAAGWQHAIHSLQLLRRCLR